jgi:ubiquinone/menaquinone biosynthesis C-methylase UbiE
MKSSDLSPSSPKVVYWQGPEDLHELVYVHSRSFVTNFSLENSLEIQEKQIYREHIYIEKNELLEIIDAAISSTGFQPQGVGIELGAGCAAISVELVNSNSEVKKIYAVEIVPEIVEFAAVPLINMHIKDDKVIPVVGDFDSLKLKDDSIDFIVEFDSLHHSFNLEKTIAESGRVLKSGGQLLAIDRSHWRTSKRRRLELENQQYSKKFLQDRGIADDTVLTRADNGEHEYLLSEYITAFKNAGFSDIKWVFLIDPSLSILKLALISSVSSRLRKNTRYHYVQTWPLRKLIFPVMLMKFFKLQKVGNFVNLPKANGSKRFQAKTVLIATK